MNQLSSDSTGFGKQFARAAIVLLVVGAIVSLVEGDLRTFMAALAMGLLGALGLYWEFQLADEVVDLGESILVARGDERRQFGLQDIERIERSPQWQRRYFILHLRAKSEFGDSVRFIPRYGIGEPERVELNRRFTMSRVQR